MNTTNEAPCLVTTAQGASVLYKNRYVFSRFAPKKSLHALLDTLSILPESLILCLSPVLPFPIAHIQKKITQKNILNCFILAIECDTLLYNFFLEHLDQPLFEKSCALALIQNAKDIALLLEGQSPKNMHYTGTSLPPLASFKRVIIIEASGEVQQNKAFYTSVTHYAQNTIAQFWKNRITLLHLGRLFARNSIQNIAHIPNALPIQAKTITKPIFVIGAGPSLDELIPFIHEFRDKIYILAIAAALRPLLDQNIRPNAVVTVESQWATERAFIGTAQSGIPVYADITSRPRILDITGGPVSFFLSEYYSSPLLDRIKHSFPSIPVFPPLGSVGLTALELALLLRTNHNKNNNYTLPIFVCGLDFSFIAGKTHCKESPHIKEALSLCTRLSPVGNPASAFRPTSFTFVGKNNKKLISDPALRGYGELFFARYTAITNIYDISPQGMPLGIEQYTITQAKKRIIDTPMYTKNTTEKENTPHTDNSPHHTKMMQKFYTDEKNRLDTIRTILTSKNTTDYKNKEKTNTELLHLIDECSYLYLHFPDGHTGAQLRQDFLNRIRSEVDLFLKDIENANKIPPTTRTTNNF